MFRHYYALPSARDQDGFEVGAVRGVLTSLMGMLKDGVTHIAVATDHVIESFRNRIWPGYKTGDGIEPALLAQFTLLEEILIAAGIAVWPMIEFEADDALAAGAAAAACDSRVEQVVICTPDKDLAQCVQGSRIVQLNRRKRVLIDEAGVIGKFGVAPKSIPDYLALVGDSADGYPGLPGWASRSSAAILTKYFHLELIPRDWREWRVNAANASGSHIRSSAGMTTHCYFADLRPCELTSNYSMKWNNYAGMAPPGRSPRWALGLTPQLLRRSESCDR